jgi:hypothetical protein
VRTAVALALVAAALVPVATAQPRGGLYGTVTRGPTSPVCRVGVACNEPAARTTFLLIRKGETTRAKTDAAGHYRVHLAPGRYTVSKGNWGPGGISPSSVVVPAARFAHRNFAIDTGLR